LSRPPDLASAAARFCADAVLNGCAIEAAAPPARPTAHLSKVRRLTVSDRCVNDRSAIFPPSDDEASRHTPLRIVSITSSTRLGRRISIARARSYRYGLHAEVPAGIAAAYLHPRLAGALCLPLSNRRRTYLPLAPVPSHERGLGWLLDILLPEY
jgi:hypothetical protein